jgi:hypothetical protein
MNPSSSKREGDLLAVATFKKQNAIVKRKVNKNIVNKFCKKFCKKNWKAKMLESF